MRSDRYLYEELNRARQAEYEYGYDGAQWIQDNLAFPYRFSGRCHPMDAGAKSGNGWGQCENIQAFVNYQQQEQQ